jgi:hypothetical protein
MDIKLAYAISELAKAGPLRRSSLYQAIKEGRLVAQKAGRRTIITHENYQKFLKSLPVIGHEARLGGTSHAETTKPCRAEPLKLDVGENRPEQDCNSQPFEDRGKV